MGLSPEAQAILDARKAKQAEQKEVVAPAPAGNKPPVDQQFANNSALLASFADMVPNLDGDLPADAAPTEDQDAEEMLDKFIETLSFKEAYEKFCGKGAIKWSGADENNFVRCPNLHHEDKKPSTWFRISTKVWKCGGCDDGGGIIDLVGATMGIASVRDRKNKNYHDIRRHIARAYGWTVFTRLDGTLGVAAPGAPVRTQSAGGAFAKLLRKAPANPEGNPAPAPASVPESEPGPESVVHDQHGSAVSSAPTAPVLRLVPADQGDSGADDYADDGSEGVPDIPWRQIFTDETFIKAYMDANCQDDSSEMYHLWSALVAISMTTGREITLKDRDPIYGNLSICLLGDSGQGKTRSRGPLVRLLKTVMPYDEDQMIAAEIGALLVPNPKTGEGLTAAFARPETVPLGGGRVKINLRGNVRGLAMFEEFSELVSLGKRAGSTIKETIMAGADCGDTVMGGTTKGDGTYTATDHFMSAWSSTQPDRLDDLLDKGDKSSGFLNRWVFVTGVKKERQLFGDDTTIDQTRAQLFFKNIYNQTSSYGTYQIDMLDDAKEAFNAFLRTVVHPAMDTGKTDMLARLNLIVRKLALLLTINAGLDKVTVPIIEQVKAFYPYLLETYRLIDSSVGRPTKSELEDYILKVVKTHQEKTGENITMGLLKDKTRKNKLVRDYGGDAVHKALLVLKAWGDVDIHEPVGGKLGKPTQTVEALA